MFKIQTNAPEEKGLLLVSETESSDEEPTKEDLAFIDDMDVDTDSDGDWVSAFDKIKLIKYQFSHRFHGAN